MRAGGPAVAAHLGDRMRNIHFLAALPLTCLFAGQALAQACTKPLSLRNEIQMTSTGGGPSAVPVQINGTDQKLTLATASPVTQISPDLVKSLNMTTKRAGTVLYDEAGNSSNEEVTTDKFGFGKMEGSKLSMFVQPERGGRGGGGGEGGFGAPAGLFSLDFMRRFDIDVDFGSDKLRFFDQDHCPGGVLYWKAEGAVGVVPLTAEDGRVTVPVQLDGKAITGVIDTTARTSFIYNVVADRVLGVEPGGPKAVADKPSRDFNGQSYTYTAALTIGALSLPGTPVMLKPEPASKGGGGAMEAANRSRGIAFAMQHPELLIGMDVLRKLHLYLAFGEKKLYLTTTTSTLPAAAPKPAGP
jgi:hypothetical protein